MSGGNNPPPGGGGGNRTVFRPSPLAGMRQGQGAAPPPPPAAPPSPSGFDRPPTFGASPPPPPPPIPAAQPQSYQEPPPAGFTAAQSGGMPGAATSRLTDDDIPVPSRPLDSRSPLVQEAGPVLALAASVRSGRARIAMPAFHREASQAIAAYDKAIAPLYPEEMRMRARYALCATVDDIAQNLPGIGQDGAEWARRSLVVMFFRENIGGDRFWQIVDELLQRPAQNAELIELFAACLAAGFEGRFRVMPDGRARLQQIMQSLYGALEHPRGQSTLEVAPHWKGAEAPLEKIGLLNKVLLAAAAALAGLLIIYIILRLLLMSAGSDPWDSVRKLTPDEPMRLSRVGATPPPVDDSAQASRLKKFLEPEIRQKLVVVEEDANTVRVRTTVGQLFESASDQLESGREALFRRIGRAVEEEPGEVTIEGHADSDQISNLTWPDNTALSKARAQTVANIIGNELSNPGRITVKGYGDSRAIASNDTAEGKSKNRRVEIVVPRRK
ncbi:MAG: type IVB secretion system protein IcmH/DotU [Novosphingobium sp.]|nr:type IVB secretion system protein IcmH/DotU [Novosphingobium sp.]